jgi:hypothetical protein
VEGHGAQSGAIPALNRLLHAGAHFAGGVFGKGERQDLVGARVPLADQARDALHQNAGLAGAGAGHHQHGPVDMFDGLELPLVEGYRHRVCEVNRLGQFIIGD